MRGELDIAFQTPSSALKSAIWKFDVSHHLREYGLVKEISSCMHGDRLRANWIQVLLGDNVSVLDSREPEIPKHEAVYKKIE